MKKLKVIAFAMLMLAASKIQAQEKWITRNGKINFFSKTTAENIDANNNEVFSMID